MQKKSILCLFLIALIALNSLAVYASTNKKVYISVVKSNPVDKATNFDVSKSVTITFSSKIFRGVQFNKINLIKIDNKPVSISTAINACELTLKPKSKLEYNTKYTLTIPIGSIKDSNGNSLSKDYVLQFTTVDKTTPEL